MSTFFTLFLLSVLLLIVHTLSHKGTNSMISQDTDCKMTDYSYSVLALTWIGEYCSENTCVYDWRKSWNGKGFFIHGYWPSSVDLSFLSCLSYPNKYDPNCYVDYPFNENNISPADQKLMEKYWPQIGNVRDFWEYQWKRHGTCYMSNVLKDFPNKFTKNQIIGKYFNQTLAKYLSVSKLNGVGKDVYNSKDEFSRQLGIPKNMFYTVCNDDDELDQLRICYTRGQPGKQTMMNCPKPPRQCPLPFYLNNFKK